MKQTALFAWIGIADLKASKGAPAAGAGPICQAAKKFSFTNLYLLSDHPRTDTEAYRSWLSKQIDAEIKIIPAKLSSPTCHAEIYEHAVKAIESVKKAYKAGELSLTYHLSPGTPAMASIWLLIGKTIHPARLIESSPQQGVQVVNFPFELSADYLPFMTKAQDDELLRLTLGLPPDTPEFDAIIHRCDAMKRLVAKARRLALHDVPVLLLGESGTGKELFARAIHAAGKRKDGPFVAVNCGAIPQELFESEFFGHEKGAFTGAIQARAGYVEQADGGTLFLDEVGDLPKPAQVKLLRALQDGMVQRVGATKPKKIDIRVIAATNRDLVQDVADGLFREDLFHRLAVGVLQIPPLRERRGDLSLLIENSLDRINREMSEQTGWKYKKLSAGAKNLMLQHPWQGNIRELINTLSRAAIWVTGDTIQTEDIKEALFSAGRATPQQDSILNRPIGEGFSLSELIAEVSKHYLKRAIEEAKGNKTLAAKLTGLPNYQTFINWMNKHKV
jgi:DNA-binding NtrC family response regulator